MKCIGSVAMMMMVMAHVVGCGADGAPVIAGARDGGGPVDGGAGPVSVPIEGGAEVDSGRAPREGTPIDVTGPCDNLQCRQRTCTDGAGATLSGTVYDPAGRNPLYGVAVYVPNEALQPLPEGVSCECESLYSGKPIASALTDASGRFTLENVPDGANVPLVVQIGKWRRQFSIPSVAPCQDNPLPDQLLRLPGSRSQGDLPNIAVATGGSDTLECLLRRIGVDASEYVPGPAPDGRVHIFQGSPDVDALGGLGALLGLFVAPNTAPPAPTAASALWNATQSLLPYDLVLLSCEGAETTGMNQQALHDYASAGGRVFASHYHYAWFNTGPYASENLATWVPDSIGLGDVEGSIVKTLPGGQPFPKGEALESWLGNVGALRNGKLPIEQARHNAVVGSSNTASQAWIVSDSAAPGTTEPSTQYFSFNTPTEVQSNQCGRVVFSALHVGAASGDSPYLPVPAECTDGPLSPQEAALEFMLFDLSACITTADRPPEPPPVLLR